MRLPNLWIPLCSAALAIAVIETVNARGQDASRPSYVPRDSIVRIDAVVTDARGRPIPDLRRDDFALIDGGALQTLDTVEFHGGGQPPARTAAAARAPLDAPDSPAPTGRLLALFLDEYHVSGGANTERVRDSLRRFVDAQLHSDDLVAVMKPLDSVLSIRLTRTREELRAAIDSFSGCKGEYEPRTPLEASVIGHAPRTAEMARSQIVMSGLQALATRLGGQRAGRKAIVLVSEGFDAGGVRSRIRLPDAQSVVRAAQRFDVAIYAFNPATDAAPAALDGPDVLRAMADQTSGEATSDGREIDAALLRVARDLDAYYVLSFKPAGASDGRFHPIELRVKRKGAIVRTRSGYWTPSIDELRRARASATPAAPVFRPKPQKISPLVQPWIRMTRAADGRTRMQFMWEAKAVATGSTRTPPAVGALVLTATAADGTPLFNGRISPARGGADRSSPIYASIDARPGVLALEMSIEDVSEHVLDTDARTINVPDLNGPRTIIGTPEVLRTRTAVDFRAAVADLTAMPTFVRAFSRSETLLIRVPAFGSGGAPAVVTARLLNALGQPMRDLPTVDLPATDGITQFDLVLASLPPGEYRIEVTATAGDSQVKEAFAFRVTA